MIQIKSAATYGLLKDGIVRPMTKDSGPFETTAEAEARLVAQGHAEYVGSEEEATATEPKPLGDLTQKELRKLGKEYGLTFKVGMTKAEMVAQIEEHLSNDEPIGMSDTPPDETVEEETEDEDDGEDAPSFDAAEAVV